MFRIEKQEGRLLPSRALGGLMGDSEDDLVRLRLVVDVVPTDQASVPAPSALRALAEENVEGKNDAKLGLRRDWPYCEYHFSHGKKEVVVQGDVVLTPMFSVVKSKIGARWTVEVKVPVPLVGELLFMIDQDGVQVAVDPAQQKLPGIDPKKRVKTN